MDVSSYQGEVDWQTLAGQGIAFAWIKATEGSSFTDRCFAYNYAEAQKTTLCVGAYHFFSYDSSGETQAKNFIRTVAETDNMLPPAVDIEFYGDYAGNPKSREEVTEELQSLLNALEEHYHRKPVLYATGRSYSMYLSGAYEDYDIWIRNMIAVPSFADGREWRFWQYTDKAQLDGYHGEEPCIDMNIFNGTPTEFYQYVSERTE